MNDMTDNRGDPEVRAHPATPDHRAALLSDRPAEPSRRPTSAASAATAATPLPLFAESSPPAHVPPPRRARTRLRREPRSSVRILVDVPYAMQALSCGRTYVYELLNRGELPIVKLGRSTRIPLEALETFVDERLNTAVRP